MKARGITKWGWLVALPARRTIENLLFGIGWLFIGATSAYDAYLTIRFARVLEEENPFGRYLIALATPAGASPDVSLMIGVKMFGTIVVLGLLVLLHQSWRRGANMVIAGLAACQTALMFYLLLF